MIRVVLRDIDDADGVLLGDFPPSELFDLQQLLSKTHVWFGEDDRPDAEPKDIIAQFIVSGHRDARRMVLELVVDLG
jgi:hypothetical protein